jgi:exonuclease V gamma subunit
LRKSFRHEQITTMQCVFSNHLSELLKTVQNLLAAERFDSPLAEDWLVVPNQDTGRWLQMQLASQLGGLVNTRILTIDQLFKALAPDAFVISLDTVIFWSIAKHWHSLHPNRNSLELANEVSLLCTLFQRYLSERPDWLIAWESFKQAGPEGAEWQMELWRSIAPNLPSRPQDAILALANGSLAPTVTTVSRIFLFAPDRLSDIQLQVLLKLSNERPCICLAQSPSPSAWFVDGAFDDPESHSLLTDLAREKRRLISMLADLAPIDGFRDPTPGGALNTLKYGLYQNQKIDIDECPSVDGSLRFIAASSPTQEVESLKIWIINYLNKHPDKTLKDIAIVTPNPSLYGPIVQRVFTDQSALMHLPTASDPLFDQPIQDACLQFLGDTRRLGFQASRLVCFLSKQSIRTNLNLADQDLRNIERWLIRSGARRGLDGHKHSLTSARDRILRGLIIDPNLALAADATPTEAVENSHAIDALLGCLNAQKMILELPDVILIKDGLDAFAICLKQMTLGTVKNLVMPSMPDHFQKITTPIETLIAWFQSTIKTALSRPFSLNEQVSINSPQSARAIPLSALAILGANDGTFPSEQKNHPWDLIAKMPRSGDPNGSESERQVLLDLILNTSDRLWISWIGEHPVTLKKEFPGSGIFSLLQAIESVPEKQKEWVLKLDTGLSMATPKKGSAIEERQHSNEMQTQFQLHEFLSAVKDPAATFLRAKGAKISHSNEDQLQLEPITIDPLNRFKIRDAYLGSGDRQIIREILLKNPEIPSDLDLERLLETYAPINVQTALKIPAEEYPAEIIELSGMHLEIIGLKRANVPRLTIDSKFENRRTLSALIECLVCFAIEESDQPIDIVTFESKVHPFGPISRADSRLLLTAWLSTFKTMTSCPVPLISPIAIKTAKQLKKDPNTRHWIHWSDDSLNYSPQFRRLFSDSPSVHADHTELVRQLVLPLLAYLGKARAAF